MLVAQKNEGMDRLQGKGSRMLVKLGSNRGGISVEVGSLVTHKTHPPTSRMRAAQDLSILFHIWRRPSNWLSYSRNIIVFSREQHQSMKRGLSNQLKGGYHLKGYARNALPSS